MGIDIIPIAINIAVDAHRGQVRKYSGLPYIVHPLSVAGLVADVTPYQENVDSIIAVAILHDVVEDTSVSLEVIRGIMGSSIAGMVDDLTEKTTLSDGNRKFRKNMELKRLSKVHYNSQTIKLADLIDNARSIIHHDKNFARVFIHEMENLLDVLVGDDDLHRMADNVVKNYRKDGVFCIL